MSSTIILKNPEHSYLMPTKFTQKSVKSDMGTSLITDAQKITIQNIIDNMHRKPLPETLLFTKKVEKFS